MIGSVTEPWIRLEFYPDAVLRLEKVIDDGAYDLRLIPSGGQPHLQGFRPLRAPTAA